MPFRAILSHGFFLLNTERAKTAARRPSITGSTPIHERPPSSEWYVASSEYIRRGLEGACQPPKGNAFAPGSGCVRLHDLPSSELVQSPASSPGSGGSGPSACSV